MKKVILLLWIIIVLANIGCASKNYNNQVSDIKGQEQIEKDFKEGKISHEDFSAKMLEAGKHELERKYSKGEIEEIEYNGRKAAVFMESIYQHLAYSANEDHLQRPLQIAEESQLAVADLLLYRLDGIVSISIDKEQVGRNISSIDDDVRLDKEGRLVEEDKNEKGSLQTGEKQRRMGMVRPLYNRDVCYACHQEDKRVLGYLYIMFNAEDWLSLER